MYFVNPKPPQLSGTLGKFIVVAVAVSAFFLSCEKYQPEGEFFKELQQVASTSDISLNAFNDEDTITIYTPTTFSFNVIDLNLQLEEVKVLLDGGFVSGTMAATGSFFINTDGLSAGPHKMKILLTLRPGTGSLADKYGEEKVEDWREWTLMIDKTPPPQPVLVRSIENGFLKVSWEPFTKGSFINYVLTVNGQSYVITDPTKTSYVDSSYVGGVASSYHVMTSSLVGYGYSDFLVVNDDQSLTLSSVAADSSMTISWRRSKYPGSFLSATLSCNGIDLTTTDPNDTTRTFKIPLLLGRGVQLNLVINAKYPKAGQTPFVKGFYIDNPLGLPRINTEHTLYYSETFGGLLAYLPQYRMIRRFDQSMQRVDSVMDIFGIPQVPYPGRLAYFSDYTGIWQLNLVTNERKHVDTKGYYGSTFTPSSFSGSDNGLASYGLVDYTYSWDKRYDRGLIDMNSGELLWSYDISYDPNNYYGTYILSDNGEHGWLRQQVFTVDETGFVSSGFVSGLMGFRSDNNDELIVRSFPTTIVDANNESVLRTLDIPESGFIIQSYDPATKCLFYTGFDAERVYLVHIETGEVTMINAWANGSTYMGGYLFGQDGTYIKVK